MGVCYGARASWEGYTRWRLPISPLGVWSWFSRVGCEGTPAPPLHGKTQLLGIIHFVASPAGCLSNQPGARAAVTVAEFLHLPPSGLSMRRRLYSSRFWFANGGVVLFGSVAGMLCVICDPLSSRVPRNRTLGCDTGAPQGGNEYPDHLSPLIIEHAPGVGLAPLEGKGIT